MSLLFSFLGDKATPAQQNPEEVIDKLCDRIITATLLEDRRAAVMGLKGLAREWKLQVGSKGLSILVHVLKNDRMDVEIIQAVLETLKMLCTADSKKDPQPNDLGIMFTEIYIKDAENVTLLLDILEEPDFYVRFSSVELLSTLLHNKSDRLQECILKSPIGVSRLIDLLDDRRDAIRNEGLLLLIALTQTNADIQKIIAFENAFEKLFDIMLEEGATDGGIIVQDCLQLCRNLLRYNVSNQNLFRENGLIQRVSGLLVSRAISPDGTSAMDVPLSDVKSAWSSQKVSNTNMVLDLIRILVVPNSPNTATNQNVFCQSQTIQTLTDLGLLNHIPVSVRIQSIYAVADMIRGNKNSQDQFSKVVVRLPPQHDSSHTIPVPAVQAFIQLAFTTTKPDEFSLRTASTYAFQCYVHDNLDTQLAVAATFTAPPVSNPNDSVFGGTPPESVGSLLLNGILEWDDSRRDPFKCWFAATMLCHVLRKNDQCKEMALNLRFGEPEPGNVNVNGGQDDSEDELLSLLHRVVYCLIVANRENADTRIQVALLALLCTWLFDFTPGVMEFLNEGSNLQFLIEQVNKSSGVDVAVQGLSAFLLGICIEYNDNSESAFTRASLQSIITNRIGVDVFMSRVERLKESKPFQRVSPSFQIAFELDSKSLPDLYFDYGFTEFLKSSFEEVARAATASKQAGGKTKEGLMDVTNPNSLISSYKELIHRQDKDLAAYKLKVKELESALANEATKHTQTITHLQQQLEQLTHQHRESIESYARLEKEQEDLLVCLAEQDMDMKRMRQRLRELGDVVESDDEGGEEEDDGGIV